MCKNIYVTCNRLDITCHEFCKTIIYFSLSQIHLWYKMISLPFETPFNHFQVCQLVINILLIVAIMITDRYHSLCQNAL